MTKIEKAASEAAQLVLMQAATVASEVAKAEIIVNHAIGTAVMALSTTGHSGTLELAQYAKGVLQVASDAAIKVLKVAKEEAELTLSLARSLAISHLAEKDTKLEDTRPK